MALRLEENKYGLKVTCHKCKRDYNQKSITKCSHPNSQRYKSIVYVGRGTKAKLHNTKVFDEALIAAIQFKKEVKSGALSIAPAEISEDPASWSFYQAGNKFINFKHGVNVPIQLKENLSDKHLDSIKFYIKQFLEIMSENGINPRVAKMSSLNENHVHLWASSIQLRYSKGSWNAPLRIMRMWTNFMINRKRVQMFNYFNDVKLVKVENKVSVLTKHEFDEVCKAVEKASPYQYLNGNTTKRKVRFKPYLTDMFKLMLNTGLRREEVLSLTWNDIYSDQEGFTIITDNKKVERMMNQSYQKKFVPIHRELGELLNRLGWETNAGSENYIVAPDRSANINTLISYCTKGFTHYYKQAFPDRPVRNLNILRKTYLTYLTKATGDKVVLFHRITG